MTTFESLKGFRDFYPEEMAARREVFDVVADVARRWGYREIQTPALESLELYEVKSGEEIVEETYSFEDKGGREVTMTPELTPSVARMVAAKQQAYSKPLKLFALPRLWRYEQPQSGRLREFEQPNLDVFGVEEATAEAELIAVADEILTELGLEAGEDYEFRVSHRDLIEGVVADLGIAPDRRPDVYRVVDKSERLDEDEQRGRLEAIGIGDAAIETLLSFAGLGGGFDALDELAEIADDATSRDAIDRLREVAELLDDYGARGPCVVDPSVVRGMDYYTGTVFECFDVDGDLRAIFGGGRYDGLVEEFGGQPMAACGFGLGDATLQLLMEQAGVWPDEAVDTDYFVAVIGDVRDTANRVARSLRADGHVVEMALAERGFSDQLDRADRVNASTTVIVGERDLEEGEVTVKDMATGDQEQRDVEDLL